MCWAFFRPKFSPIKTPKTSSFSTHFPEIKKNNKFLQKMSQFLLPISLFLLAVLASFSSSEAFRQQSVGVRGRLMCGDKPLANTKVKLWNKNHLGRDDQLADALTDANGNFAVDGGVGALFGMNVHFKIYHDCDRGILPCQRKVNLGIPSEYVSRSSHVQKWFDAGTMNMQFKFPDESTSCIN